MYNSRREVRLEECLVALEHHAVLDLAVLVQVQPGPIGALPPLEAVVQDPLALLVPDRRLHLREELVLNADIAVGDASHHYLLVLVRARATQND